MQRRRYAAPQIQRVILRLRHLLAATKAMNGLHGITFGLSWYVEVIHSRGRMVVGQVVAWKASYVLITRQA